MNSLPQSKCPFVYGRVLRASDAACPRPSLEAQVQQTVQNDGRLALVGDRRMGKSSLVQRTLEINNVPTLRLNFHEVLDISDVIMRTISDLQRFLNNRNAVSKNLASWLTEMGVNLDKLRINIGHVEISASLGIKANDLKTVFGYIRDASERIPFALFIDELQDIRDRLPEAVGNAALAIIRDETQQMAKCPVFFAGSARESFNLLFTSDASPFFQHAVLVHVNPMDPDLLRSFIVDQFSKGHGIDLEAVQLIQTIAGDSPNDIQLLCYETWTEHLSSDKPASVQTVQIALNKVLMDLTPFGEKWLSDLSSKQQRLVFAIAFLEHIGASTGEFLEFADIRHPGDIKKGLSKTLKGKEALLEKEGSRYRFRSRFARLWFALRFYRVQALIPVMRSIESYRKYLRNVLPALPVDPLKDVIP